MLDCNLSVHVSVAAGRTHVTGRGRSRESQVRSHRKLRSGTQSIQGDDLGVVMAAGQLNL